VTSDAAVQTAVSDGVLVITLDRPERRNALTTAMLEALRQAIADAPARGARAAVLTARGTHFCAGADVRQLTDEAGRDRLVELSWAVIRDIAEAPVPTVCALNGPALGGGVELALSCDLRVAVNGATLQPLGLQWGAVTCARLARYLPLGVATGMLWLQRPLDVERAAHWGLVNDVADTPQNLAESAQRLARQLAALPLDALLHSRRLLRDSAASWDALIAEQALASRQGWSGGPVAFHT
jgi:enoyl-CoA hydratase/carnithine racemase